MNLFRQGRLIEAETELREALELHPSLPVYRLNLIDTLLAQGKSAEAKEFCVDWNQLMGNSAPTFHEIAVLALCCPDPARRNAEIAAKNARKAIDFAPTSAKAWRALGWANYCIGKLSRGHHGAREIVCIPRRRERRCRSMDRAGTRARQARPAARERRQNSQTACGRIPPLLRSGQQRDRPVVARRPSQIVDQRIWDFRQEATEMLRIMEEKNLQKTDEDPTTQSLCM